MNIKLLSHLHAFQGSELRVQCLGFTVLNIKLLSHLQFRV
jgi:hypothetical protein